MKGLAILLLLFLIPISSIYALNQTEIDEIYSVLESEYSLFVSVISLMVSIIAVFLAVAIFTIQQAQGKKLKKLVHDVYSFAEDQKTIREQKRVRYSKGILFTLRLIDYEIEGIIIKIEFFKRHQINKSDLDSYASSKYERIQQLFMDMKIEYDTILEIFDHHTEQQYINVNRHVRTHKDIWKHVLSNTSELEKSITNMDNDFKKFKDKLISFIPEKSKSDFKDLFEQQKRNEVKSKI